MKEIRHLKTMKNKRNLNTKWLLLKNDQNADTTLLHSHDDMSFVIMLTTDDIFFQVYDVICRHANELVGTC